MNRTRGYAVILLGVLLVLAPMGTVVATSVGAGDGVVAQTDDNETAGNETTATADNETVATTGNETNVTAGNQTNVTADQPVQLVQTETLRQIRSEFQQLNTTATPLSMETDRLVDNYLIYRVQFAELNGALLELQDILRNDTQNGAADLGGNETNETEDVGGNETNETDTVGENETDEVGDNETAVGDNETAVGDNETGDVGGNETEDVGEAETNETDDEAGAVGDSEAGTPNGLQQMDTTLENTSLQMRNVTRFRNFTIAMTSAHLQSQNDTLAEIHGSLTSKNQTLGEYRSQVESLNETLSTIENETVRQRFQQLVQAHNESVQQLFETIHAENQTVTRLLNSTAQLNSSLQRLDLRNATNETANVTIQDGTVVITDLEGPINVSAANRTIDIPGNLTLTITDANVTLSALVDRYERRAENLSQLDSLLQQENETLQTLQSEREQLRDAIAQVANGTLPDVGVETEPTDNETAVGENETEDEVDDVGDNETTVGDNETGEVGENETDDEAGAVGDDETETPAGGEDETETPADGDDEAGLEDSPTEPGETTGGDGSGFTALAVIIALAGLVSVALWRRR